jgi:hypothetical protein
MFDFGCSMFDVQCLQSAFGGFTVPVRRSFIQAPPPAQKRPVLSKKEIIGISIFDRINRMDRIE